MERDASLRLRLTQRQVLRAAVIGLLVVAVSALAHSAHGHDLSMPLALATVLLVVAGCLPLGRGPIRLATALPAMLLGELVLHSWLAWFSMPALGPASTSTAVLHHGAHLTATLAPRDFSVLVPTPSMAAAHLAAAITLALVVTTADRSERFAASLLQGLSTSIEAVPVILPSARAAIVWSPIRPSLGSVISFHVGRRGPPAREALAAA